MSRRILTEWVLPMAFMILCALIFVGVDLIAHTL